jgi:hypothetical protein
MSLIDDALKRARDEAARQDDLERRAKRRWIPPEPPRPGRRGLALALALSSAAAMAGAGFWIARRSASRPALRAQTTNANRLPLPAPPAPLPQMEVAPPTGPGNVPKLKVPVGEAPEPRETALSAAPAGRPRPATRPSRSDAGEPHSARTPPPATETAIPPRSPAVVFERKSEPTSFVRVATLPGGTKIELDGIVYSETNPVALIDGRVLAPGAVVGDFQLVRIEQSRVQLRGAGKTIWITLQ